MQVDYNNTFIAALSNAFQTMLGCQVRRESIGLKGDSSPKYEVSGVIGLSGKAVGMVVMSLSENVALKAASTMLMCEAEKIDADVVDAVGGLANMVAGAAKAELEEILRQLREEEIECEWGPLTLEVGFAPVQAPAGV